MWLAVSHTSRKGRKVSQGLFGLQQQELDRARALELLQLDCPFQGKVDALNRAWKSSATDWKRAGIFLHIIEPSRWDELSRAKAQTWRGSCRSDTNVVSQRPLTSSLPPSTASSIVAVDAGAAAVGAVDLLSVTGPTTEPPAADDLLSARLLR